MPRVGERPNLRQSGECENYESNREHTDCITEAEVRNKDCVFVLARASSRDKLGHSTTVDPEKEVRRNGVSP